ncbi:MAG: PrsW family glutamic-type intramembrane protease [Bacillota bacterium]|nr:PrsW family glutamic-type intramembrane protease [Bacillota bacterium]
MNLNLILTAVTPGIALAVVIYLVDKHDREPVKLLIKTFVGGAIITIPTIFLESFLVGFNIFGGLIGIAYQAFIVAGFSEEFMKRLVVNKVAYYNKYFDEKLDGIVYAVFSALGFATVENIIYVVFRFSDVESVGVYRAILSVPAHMLFAVTMGYYLSLAKFSKTEIEKRFYYKKSLTAPMILHGTFNFILMSGNGFLMIFFLPFVVYLWSINIKKLNIYYQESKIINTVDPDDGDNL